jgi:hypothetical protein
MKTALVVGIVLIFAGTARAQLSGGSLNTGSALNSAATVNNTVGSNGAGSINPESGTSTASSAHANRDASVNQNSKNPGEYVPSTFSSYKDALETAKLEAALHPTTLAEAARLAQEAKKKAGDKPAIQLEQDERGNLVISSTKK